MILKGETCVPAEKRAFPLVEWLADPGVHAIVTGTRVFLLDPAVRVALIPSCIVYFAVALIR